MWGFDEPVWQAVEEHNGSRTIAYKNDDSIHLVGVNGKSAYCCKYDNSDSSIICTATKCGELTETSSFQGTAKDVVSTRPGNDAQRSEAWQNVATNPLNNIVHDNLPKEKRKQRKSREAA